MCNMSASLDVQYVCQFGCAICLPVWMYNMSASLDVQYVCQFMLVYALKTLLNGILRRSDKVKDKKILCMSLFSKDTIHF
jgi:hypothetical protein